jgi:hypothetical protein
VAVVPWTPPLDCVLVPAVPVVPACAVVPACVVVPAAAATLELLAVPADVFVLPEELTPAFVDELTLVFDDVEVEPLVFPVVVAQTAVPPLKAWTSGECIEPAHATLCGWLLPGP